MRRVEPKVYLIASPKIDWATVKDYLEEVGGLAWLDRKMSFIEKEDSGSLAEDMAVWQENSGQDLIEVGGRLCYRSWEPGLNPNVSRVRTDQAKYLENVLSSGHGCYDGETEVLTQTGWRRWGQVGEEDRFATRTVDGRIEFHHATRLISYYHKGRMYRVDARGVDLLVTPDHNMLVCPTTTREGRRREQFALMRAEELGHRSHAYIKTAVWDGGEDDVTADEMAMLGFAIGDGHIRDRGGDGSPIDFHLRRERKISWLTNLVARLGWKMDLFAERDLYRVHVPDDDRLRFLFDDIYLEDGQKKIPLFAFLKNRSILEGLFEGLLQSDGHEGRTGDSFDTTSDYLADQVQHLCLLIGLAANVCYRREDRESSYGDRPLTRLSIIRRELTPEVNRYVGGVGRTFWVEDWEGQVYCAEVPNNTLYVRRNGKPVWSGNSVLEHANYTFILHNVSRVFTHEIVRHRPGAAYSQESMRFVRLTDIPFWFPEWAQQDDELMTRATALLDLMESFQIWMAGHFGLDDPGVPFSEKKAKTSFMRRFAPDGVATGIQFTANVRTLRHTISMRTDSAAEEEIRLVFNKIAEIMVAECPVLFGDFEKTEVEPGIYHWRPANWKV